jgi:hypothetical protein
MKLFFKLAGEGTQECATRTEKKFSMFGSGAYVKSRPWQKNVGELLFVGCYQ